MMSEERKIRVFWANMYLHGIQIIPNERGTGLIVNRLRDVTLSPLVQEEICKRAALLLNMLTPLPPAKLRDYFYRLLRVEEVNAAMGVARECGVVVNCAVAGPGNWLLAMGEEQVNHSSEIGNDKEQYHKQFIERSSVI